MNEYLERYARDTLKYDLTCCSKQQQKLFKQMYSPKDMDKTTNEIVDAMEVEKLDWAMQQVKLTLLERK